MTSINQSLELCEPWPNNIKYKMKCYWEHLRVGNLIGTPREKNQKIKIKIHWLHKFPKVILMGSLDTLPNTMAKTSGNNFILVKALISSCWEFQSQFFAINLVQSIKVFGRYKYDKPKETLLVYF